MISFKKIAAPNGLPGWRVSAGAQVIGTIFNPGPAHIGGEAGMAWQGTSVDGTRFAARSKPKLVQRLQIHAAQARTE